MASFNDYLNSLKHTAEYYAEAAKDEFVNELLRLMSEKGINQKELAGKAGVSPAYVSKVLSGDMNLSIESMSKFTFALDARIEISTTSTAEQNKSTVLSTSAVESTNTFSYDYYKYSSSKEKKSLEYLKTGDYKDGNTVSAIAA